MVCGIGFIFYFSIIHFPLAYDQKTFIVLNLPFCVIGLIDLYQKIVSGIRNKVADHLWKTVLKCDPQTTDKKCLLKDIFWIPTCLSPYHLQWTVMLLEQMVHYMFSFWLLVMIFIIYSCINRKLIQNVFIEDVILASFAYLWKGNSRSWNVMKISVALVMLGSTYKTHKQNSYFGKFLIMLCRTA